MQPRSSRTRLPSPRSTRKRTATRSLSARSSACSSRRVASAKATNALETPSSIREVIGSRMRRLSEPSQKALVVASVLGREFALDSLEHMSRLSREALLDVLDEATAERVVGEVPGTSGRVRFAHALIRDTLYDELTSARRIRLHRDAGEVAVVSLRLSKSAAFHPTRARRARRRGCRDP
jgi:hypothetical protein